MSEERLIDIARPVTVCKASAGTGKTYTLAAYYIGLLLSGEDYRSILAITFTNKATAEMSERILTYLYAIARGEEQAFLDYAKRFMVGHRQPSDAELRTRAGECFRTMLADYDNVQIQTIDSFLQTLLSGLTSLLRQQVGASTELDVKQVIRRAVDEMLDDPSEPAYKAIIEDFVGARLEEEGNWNIRKDLCAFAEEMYNESVQQLDSAGLILFDAERVAARRERILAQWEKNEDRTRVRTLLTELEQQPIDESYGKQPMKDLLALIKNTHDSLERPEKTDKTYLYRGLSDSAYKNAASGSWGKVPAAIAQLAAQLTEASRACRSAYYTIQMTVELSHEMQFMSALQTIINRQLYEANSALLSRTASVLSEALKSGDADFILEKAGIRYKHVLMDEFQDTSQLQWQVIRQLLMDVLAGEGNTLLVVGDIKQSIYRWRNGDWHIMNELTNEGVNELTKERLNGRFTSLKKNFRSSEEVVKFNLGLFNELKSQESRVESGESIGLTQQIYDEGYTPEDIEEYYQGKKKKGGYVRFKAVATKDESGARIDTEAAIISDMFDRMEELMAAGAAPSDMMILIRKGAQAAPITEAHAALDPEVYPHLSAASMVSAQSFLLESSEAVQLVISGLRVVAQRDELAARHIEIQTQRPELVIQLCERVQANTPLYEAVSEIVKLLLTDEHGAYCGRETAYVNCLLDRTREYVQANGSNIGAFLEYWNETLSEKSIPVSSLGAIQIMTIHKSKGLQAQTLFVPFCNWKKDDSKSSQKIWCPIAEELHEGEDFIPIYNKETMLYTPYAAAYEEEHFNAYIDSLNMLYVALTRAEDNLFIYTDYTPGSKSKGHVGYAIIDYVGAPDFEIGAPKVRVESGESRVDSGKPFSFEGTEKTEAELWSSSDQVRFVQSQEGAMYTEYGEEAYRRVARMDEGTLCHDIFAHIRKADELDDVLDVFESKGEIQDKEQRERLRNLISAAWQGNAQMKDWFTAPWELRLEEAIYLDEREIRPDRVMINPQTKEAIVLDYKFGHWEDKYLTQVRDYQEALRRIGYSPVRGYLWFAREKRLVEVKGKR